MKDNRLGQRIQHSLNAELSGLNTTSWQRNQFFENATGGTRVKRKLTYSLVLAIVMLLIAATALAAAITNGFGLMDFWKDTRDNVEIPEDAGQYIEHDLAVEETEHFTVRFREALYDGKTCHIVYDVIPRSKELLLFDKPLDEYWYAQTHLNPDHEKMKVDGRTILDRWDEGGYASGWQVDIDVGSDTEDIREYSSEGVLDEETGIYTGQIDVTLGSLREERTLRFIVRMLPLQDMHDEESMDYDHDEYVHMERTFHAAMSGEEVILVNTNPVLFPSIGVQVDQVRLMVLPQEIQYQIDYSLTDATLYHSIFDDHPDADRTVTLLPLFRFVEATRDGDEPVALSKGITDNFSGYSVDEEKGLYRQTGSLGRSNFSDTYTLCAYRISVPIETVTFQVDVQNPDTFTPEERVWQQESDRSKPHNEADDTFVNPTESDFPQEEAIRIAKEAILKAYSLPDDALNHVRVVTNLYVTEQRPDYRRWFIQFQVLREGSDDYVEKYYSCIVDPEGNVIGDPDINEKSVFEYAENKQSSVIATYNDYVMNKAGGWVFQYWSPELKADFSEKVLPEVSAIVESGDLSLLDNGGDIDYDLMAIATHRYGLPRETDITVEQAYQIAVDYLKEHYGLSEDIISHYDQWYYSYDTTDPDNPKWCIVFWPGGSSAMYLMNQYGHDQSSSNYRIEINPSNGTVLNDVVIRLPYSKELSWLVNRY